MTLALLEEVTQRVIFEGEGPRMLAGDFNLEEGSNPCVQIWRAHGFVEVQELYERLSGCLPRVTCKGCTRKDFVYVSPEVQSWFVKTEVDPGPFPDHGLLMGHFQVPDIPEPRLLWPRPQSRPAVTVSKLDLPAAPCPDIAGLEPSSAYRAVCAAYEDRLSVGLQQAGLPALLSQERGRASVESPVASRAVIPPVRKARHGELEATFFGSSLRHVQWLKQTRRVQALVQSLKKANPTPGVLLHRASLWNAVLVAPGFPGGFARWWPTREVCQVGDPPVVPACLPSAEVASGLFHSLVANLRAFEGHALRARCREAIERRRLQPSLIFRDLAEPRAPPVQSIVERTQAVVSEVRPDEAAVCLDREVCWKPGPVSMVGPLRFIMLRLTWCGVTLLMSLRVPLSRKVLWWLTCLVSFGRLVKHGRRVGLVMKPLSLLAGMRPPLGWFIWRRIVSCRLRPSQKSCGGQQSEPSPCTPALVLMACRGPTCWLCRPTCCSSFCSCAAMPNRPAGGRGRPFWELFLPWKSVGAERVGDYRPITVLSLLYWTWSSIRSRQALAYLSEFAPASMYGNLSGRTASQLWFRLQLQLEEARYAGVGVVGAIADLEKAFNLLPRTPVMAAARAVGIAEPILVGWCGALSAMRRHFRIRGSVGPGLHWLS